MGTDTKHAPDTRVSKAMLVKNQYQSIHATAEQCNKRCGCCFRNKFGRFLNTLPIPMSLGGDQNSNSTRATSDEFKSYLKTAGASTPVSLFVRTWFSTNSCEYFGERFESTRIHKKRHLLVRFFL